MDLNYEALEKIKLFETIKADELKAMLQCLNAKAASYNKEDIIFHEGERITQIGLVINGSVFSVNEDFWGNRTIINRMGPGQIFGANYSIITDLPLESSIIAAEKCNIIFLEFAKIIKVCSNACRFHQQIIRNLLHEVAFKNYQLMNKVQHVSKRNTRTKLLSYLSSESLRNGSNSFEIPYNRQQLADYLCVDRSAMSNELCKLRDEGILDFQKSSFILHEDVEI